MSQLHLLALSVIVTVVLAMTSPMTDEIALLAALPRDAVVAIRVGMEGELERWMVS